MQYSMLCHRKLAYVCVCVCVCVHAEFALWFFYSLMHVCVSVWESGLLLGSGRVVKLKLSVQNWVVITVAVHFRSATLTPNQCCFSTLSINAHVITTMNNRLWKASETRRAGGRERSSRSRAGSSSNTPPAAPDPVWDTRSAVGREVSCLSVLWTRLWVGAKRQMHDPWERQE